MNCTHYQTRSSIGNGLFYQHNNSYQPDNNILDLLCSIGSKQKHFADVAFKEDDPISSTSWFVYHNARTKNVYIHIDELNGSLITQHRSELDS